MVGIIILILQTLEAKSQRHEVISLKPHILKFSKARMQTQSLKAFTQTYAKGAPTVLYQGGRLSPF